MRLLAQDLRSLFLQVLGTPDFQNCDAAQGIQEKLKLMQKTAEHVTTQETSLPCANVVKERCFPIRDNVKRSMNSGTYIIGGSSLGWNFIMFQGTKPVYCGKTKDAFRACRPWK